MEERILAVMVDVIMGWVSPILSYAIKNKENNKMSIKKLESATIMYLINSL